MNLYEGAVSGAADGLVLSLGSQRLALPADLGPRRPGSVAGEARKLVVGIRPEHLTVTEGGTDRETTLAARVELDRGARQRIARPFLDGREEGPEQRRHLDGRSGGAGVRGDRGCGRR